MPPSLTSPRSGRTDNGGRRVVRGMFGMHLLVAVAVAVAVEYFAVAELEDLVGLVIANI